MCLNSVPLLGNNRTQLQVTEMTQNKTKLKKKKTESMP